MNPRHILLATAILGLVPLVASGQGAVAAPHDRAVEGSRVAVLPPTGEVKPDLAFAILGALREEATSRGWQLCDEDDIGVALTGRAGPGFASPDLIEIGRWLGAGAVVATELSDLGGEVEIRLRVLSTYDTPSAMQLRMAPRKTAAKEARTGLAAALPMAPPAALVRVPPPPAPVAAPPPAPPPAPPVQVVTLPPGYVLVAPGVIAPAPTPVAGAHQAPPPPPAAPVDPDAPLPSEGRRAAKVFGVTAGIQAGVLGLTSMLMVDYAPSGTDLQTVGILYALISPALSGLGAWGVGDRSRTSTISYTRIIGGTYAGSAISLGLFLMTYDDLNESWFFTMVLGPILLPAVGAAIAFLVGREPRIGGRVAWSPPSPTVVAATDGSGRLAPGISLGTLTF